MTDAPATEAAPAKADNGPSLWLRLLLAVAALLLSVVVVSPILLSSGELLGWAETGLGLTDAWRWLVPIALDCAAIACVLLAVYRAFLGQGAGVFGLLVWVFAGFSSFANYRHGLEPGAPADRWWFFPVISLLGPALLEAVMHFVRRLIQTRSGARSGTLPKFGVMRWLPVIGAPRDTYGARRTAQILGIATVDEAVATYHALCPSGSLKVVRAIRARDVAAAKEAADEAARAARAAARAAASSDQTDRQTALRAVASASRPSKATVRSMVGVQHQTGDQTTRNGDQIDQTGLGAQAIRDAATARQRFPDGLPDQGAHKLLKETFGWGAQKATNALAAYRTNADLQSSGGES